jgi:DNA-binding FadR family transcriptional regulator
MSGDTIRATSLPGQALLLGSAALSPVPGARDPKLAERVAAAIEADVLRAGWPVGMVIGSEDQLTVRYGVGRAVIREAVRLAEHRQVVRMRRGRGGGLVVVEPDVSAVTESLGIILEYVRADVDDLIEARVVLEGLSAATAADSTGNAAPSLFIRAIASLTEQLGTEAGAAGASSPAHSGRVGPTQRPADLVAVRIRRDIIDRGWPVGESLGFEADLMQRYGIGRAQFREAIRILENNCVVRMQRGAAGGMLVAAPDGRAIIRAVSLYLTYQGMNRGNIADLRTALETATLQLTIDRLTDEGIERLTGLLELERTWPDDDFPTVSHDLHAVIAELSGNRTLGLLQSIAMQLTAERLHSGDPSRVTEPPDAVRRAHQAIVQAIIARDAPLALRRMEKHLRAVAHWTKERTSSQRSAPRIDYRS